MSDTDRKNTQSRRIDLQINGLFARVIDVLQKRTQLRPDTNHAKHGIVRWEDVLISAARDAAARDAAARDAAARDAAARDAAARDAARDAAARDAAARDAAARDAARDAAARDAAARDAARDAVARNTEVKCMYHDQEENTRVVGLGINAEDGRRRMEDGFLIASVSRCILDAFFVILNRLQIYVK